GHDPHQGDPDDDVAAWERHYDDYDDIGPDGSPLPGAPAADEEPGAVRRIVRRAARGAYRHGVQRVAPVIRRMGEL
ncbi:hypothetical protein ABT136_24865, partial [Streptomyces sp. NPDC001856]